MRHILDTDIKVNEEDLSEIHREIEKIKERYVNMPLTGNTMLSINGELEYLCNRYQIEKLIAVATSNYSVNIIPERNRFVHREENK